MADHNGGAPTPPDDEYAGPRAALQRQLERTIHDGRVIDAVLGVPREEFVPQQFRHRAWDDSALPIGEGQTISQPLMVAIMTEALAVEPGHKVLEVGTGSGYQAAVLARLGAEVVTVERNEQLLERARQTLARLNYSNVHVHAAGDVLGRAEEAPYDRITVTAGAPHVPRVLLEQLAASGVLVVPIGPLQMQELVRVRKTPFGIELVRLGPCGFVPLIGRGAWPDAGGASRRIKVR
jgi:protein-L-isoaspartate(D-aspartate) O-methyltransferase